MEYIVALTLLVALGAWVVSSYLRLFYLYEKVQGAWQQWSQATRQRNDCVADFVRLFALCLPQGDVLPRDMRRWTEDSKRALVASPHAPSVGNVAGLSRAERSLRRVLSHSVHTLETTQPLRDNDDLRNLCSALTVSLYRQEEMAGLYNRSVIQYNQALLAPGARLVASLFGFSPAARMSGSGIANYE